MSFSISIPRQVLAIESEKKIAFLLQARLRLFTEPILSLFHLEISFEYFGI